MDFGNPVVDNGQRGRHRDEEGTTSDTIVTRFSSSPTALITGMKDVSMCRDSHKYQSNELECPDRVAGIEVDPCEPAHGRPIREHPTPTARRRDRELHGRCQADDPRDYWSEAP